MVYKILAHRDCEASVWWAESPDVKGLVAEADTLEELISDLREVVPDLLALNHALDERGALQIAVIATLLANGCSNVRRPPSDLV